jgi:hypothetical protein
VELDGAEGGLVPAVHARAGLSGLRRGRRVVHGQAPCREPQRQVQELVQVALRRERHGHHGDRLHPSPFRRHHFFCCGVCCSGVQMG